MSHKTRWRYGDTNPVVASVNPDTVIEIGDLVFQSVDNARPACELSDQELFVEYFLGVAMQRSRKGDVDPIRVATTGVFEFECVPSTFELGILVGNADVEAGRPQNQQVRAVSDPRHAIGRVAKRQGMSGSTLLVDVRSTVMTGGVKGTTAGGGG